MIYMSLNNLLILYTMEYVQCNSSWLVSITKKTGLEPRNCPKMIFIKKSDPSVDKNQDEVGDLEGSCQEF